MRYYIIAGERSGDLHGSNLAKALRERDAEAEMRGFGGEYMQSAGVSLAVNYHEMAFMGLVELVTKANKIKRFIRLCREDIEAFQPDVIILIDYGGFNLQIARYGKRRGYRIYYYILPKYWAWYQNRVNWLKPYVDRLFLILPFEKDFFRKFQWEGDYVGNPVLDAVKAHNADPAFLTRHQIPEKKDYVALLPGSRKQELRSMLPLMRRVVERFPEQHFLTSVVGSFHPDEYRTLLGLDNVSLVIEDTYNLLQHSKAAVVTSGTATLETGLFRVPQVVVYKANWISFLLANMLLSVPYICLVNLIVNREVVKELLQWRATPKAASKELRRLLEDEPYRQRILDDYDEIIRILDTGSASENAAGLMLQYLTSDR
jgi:lipid-A-disaccharide synthase